MIYGENNPAIREIIYALDGERQWMELVREAGKLYSTLIDFLLSEPIHNDDTDSALLKRMTVLSRTEYSPNCGLGEEFIFSD